MKTVAFTITLPVAEDALGRWMETHGANISIAVMFGVYHVSLGMKKLHTYSDDDGEHSEHWEISAHHKDVQEAIRRVLEAAFRARPENVPTYISEGAP